MKRAAVVLLAGALVGLPALAAATPIDEARAALNAGRIAAAAALLEASLADSATGGANERAALHELLAVCRVYQQDDGAADEELAAALLLDPDTRLDPTLFPPARIRAFTELRRTLRKRLPNLPRAELTVQEGNFAEAMRILRLFVALEPPPAPTELVRARTLLLASLVYTGDDKAAETEMRRLARLAPKLALDPAVFPAKIIERFAAVQKREASK